MAPSEVAADGIKGRAATLHADLPPEYPKRRTAMGFGASHVVAAAKEIKRRYPALSSIADSRRKADSIRPEERRPRFSPTCVRSPTLQIANLLRALSMLKNMNALSISNGAAK
jgi:hypothetical protein